MDKKKEMKETLVKLSSMMEDINFNERNLVIWGAGSTASLCQESFDRHNIHPICYVDGNKEKQGSIFYGNKIISPDDLNLIDDPLVLISSGNVVFTNDIKLKLSQKGLRNITVDEYILGKNADKVIETADMLNDSMSVNVYCDMILNRLRNRFPDEETISKDPYFAIPVFQKVASGDVFVNLGAYKGEEIERYLELCNGKNFGKIISFEPDKGNYMEMLALVDVLNKRWGIEEGKIQSVMAAVADVTKTSFFKSGQGTRSSINEKVADGDSFVDVYSLDDFMPNGKVDFLKADIESFELKMLHGAEKLIKSNVPKISICIYHSPADLFDIATYLSELDLGYKFSVRHHDKQFSETVLYAYTERE